MTGSAEALVVDWRGRHAIVRMPAEIDLVNADAIGVQLAALSHGSPDVITVDLTGTTFCDSAGVQSITHAHRLAAGNGGELRLVVGASPVRRILQLTGVDQVVPVYTDIQQSLDASR